MRSTRLAIESLEPRLVLDAGPLLLSELMAVNDGPLADEDGAFSDWVEIHNPTGSPVSLDGWYLTDDALDLGKWRFPDVSIDSSEYLVVFTSDKDRSDPDSELHTDFKLSSSGEYLALVRPDGVVSHDYSSQFPQQRADVSYGLPQSTINTTLIGAGADARVLVPLDGGLGTAWTDEAFLDSAWTAGTTGVGFDGGSDYGGLIGMDIQSQMLGTNATAYVRVPFEVDDPTGVDLLTLRMQYDDGYVAYLNGTEVASRNAPSPLQFNSMATAEHGQQVSSHLSQDFDGGGTAYTTSIYGSNPGPVVNNGGPTGRYLRLVNDDVGGNINRITFDRVHEGPAPHVVADFDFRFHSNNAANPADGMSFLLLPTSTYGDSGVGTDGSYPSEEPNVPGVFAVGFDLYEEPAGVNDVSVHWNGSEFINVTLPNSLIDLDAGVFHHARIELVESPGGMRVTVTLTPDSLGVPGAPVTAINNVLLPGMTPYESRVEFGGRTGGLYVDCDLDNVAVEFGAGSLGIAYEDVDISAYRDLLVAGDNVLAIHGLNYRANDGDFLLVPELIAVEAQAMQTDVEHYFDTPTPGLPNGTGTLPSSGIVSFSRESGTFVSSFQLTLSSDSPAAVIHYTTNGAIPSETSPVYTGPFTISTSSRIRAAAIEPDLALSPVTSHGYIGLDSSAASFDSDVPLIVLDTYGKGMGDTYLTPVTAVFIDTGTDGRADITDTPQFAGRAGLRIRGQTSQGFPKKQYAFETWDEGNSDTTTIAAQFAEDLPVSLFGMPAESDWVIQGPYSDKTLMRNYLSYSWSTALGQYAPRVLFVEVFVNQNGGKVSYPGDYVGSYVFMEKIKRDSERVDIAGLSLEDNAEPDVTGGYIWKKDKSGAGDNPWTTSEGQILRHVDPKARDITPQQQAYLAGYINDFEAALYGPNFKDPVDGYAPYIDVDSWVDLWIIVELTKNIDGFRLSTYYHKDREGPIRMGPAWDYNLSLGNADYLQGWMPNGWYGEQLGDTEYPYWRRLLEDPNFQQRLTDRWQELRSDLFTTANLLADVDEAASILNESQARNFQKWRIQGVELWPNYYVGQTWQQEVAWMRSWLEQRVAWMDTQFTEGIDFNQGGGLIDPGFELTISEPTGTVYYTLDGTDPRLSGGGISPSARIYSTGGSNQIELLGVGSTWKYRDNGSNQGTTWRANGFNDTSWPSGPAELGYGDGPEATVVGYGPDAQDKYVTTYFRRSFNVTNASNIASLALGLRRDDGAVVYLNGQEVARSNMPTGTINYQTYALDAIGGQDERTYTTFTVDPSYLQNGTNVLAVEIHQANGNSSDISFDLQLTATIEDQGSSGSAIPLFENTRVIARNRNGSDWSGPTIGTFVVEPLPDLAIAEINYRPYDPTAAEVAVNSDFTAWDFEFVELQNVSDATVSLVGVEFVTGIQFDFTASNVQQLAPGERVVIVSNLTAFEARYGTSISVAGQYEGHLSNGGEQMVLLDGAVRTILDFTYDDSGAWPDRADGRGASLELIDPDGDYDDPDNWHSSSEFGGSPGVEGIGPVDDIVVNEVLTHTDYPAWDTIELHNTTNQPIDIGGWYLSDSWGWESNPDNGNYKKFEIPSPTTIPGGGYIVFDELDFNPTPTAPEPHHFALNGAHGDDVWLMEAAADGTLTRFVDHVDFGAAKNGEAFGRWADGPGGFYPMIQPTLDPPAENSGPRVGPVVISEVMYDPPGPGGEADPDDFEFVEIHNPTAEVVTLTEWRLRKSVDYDFASGQLLQPGGVLVVVPFDVTDSVKLSAFRSYYGISSSVHIVGGYTDLLADDGGHVRLQRPDEPPLEEPFFVPHLLEDELHYDEQSPWPTGAAGTGASLHRAQADAWGNAANSWTADDPTPGAVSFQPVAAVVDRHIFYNNSAFDGGPLGTDAENDLAIALDKQALLPDNKANKANYTSYVRGINGIMVDIMGLADDVVLDPSADFRLRVGNSDDPSDWSIAPDPQLSVRADAGTGGTDRVTLIWLDGTITKQWLQVTVLPTANTRLQRESVFYFGNAVGEAGDSDFHTLVNATDEIFARNNQHGPFEPADVFDPYDFNRDRLVNAGDQIIARSNQTSPFSTLRLIRVPAESTAAALPAPPDASDASREPDVLPAEVAWWWQQALATDAVTDKSERSAPVQEVVDKLLATYWR